MVIASFIRMGFASSTKGSSISTADLRRLAAHPPWWGGLVVVDGVSQRVSGVSQRCRVTLGQPKTNVPLAAGAASRNRVRYPSHGFADVVHVSH
jgi:hypothetical protein